MLLASWGRQSVAVEGRGWELFLTGSCDGFGSEVGDIVRMFPSVEGSW